MNNNSNLPQASPSLKRAALFTACVASFLTGIKLKKGETVVFAWIRYKSKKHRDAVNKKVMKDPRLICDPKKMPFDCSRMLYGGFKAIVESGT
ncbi:MAG: DUF1428 family protein [Armatimonadetes bacterium]|nr:DUF1428 family protein [Armatimonadota bacterium]